MENVPHYYFLHSSEDKIKIFGPTGILFMCRDVEFCRQMLLFLPVH